MDGTEITATRTAVASGVCVRCWAPAGWCTAAIVGCGVQAGRHLRVLRSTPGVSVRACDPHPERVTALEGIEAAPNPRDAVRGADIVITTALCPSSGTRN